MKYFLTSIFIIILIIVCILGYYGKKDTDFEPLGSPYEPRPAGGWSLPQWGIIVDMPDPSKASSLQARLDLLVGGGGRDIVAVVTQRTHETNRTVLASYPYVRRVVNLVDSPSDSMLETRMKTELSTTSMTFIHAWPKE